MSAFQLHPDHAPPPMPPTVVALGFFDGVHGGHRTVLQSTRDEAARLGATPIAFTFRQHPRAVLQPQSAPLLLCSFETRLQRLLSEGMEHVVWRDFDREFAALSPQQFVQNVLQGQLNAVGAVTGPNYRFGHRAAGTVDTLRGLLANVRTVEPVSLDGEVVSSTRIRQVVENGDMEQAARLLGEEYMLEGTVERGDGRGVEVGAPTANLPLPQGRVIPPYGVYAVRVRKSPGGDWWAGVANLGVRPTFGGDEPRLEVHLLDRRKLLYGAPLEVRLVSRLREERRFPSPEALRQQIQHDVAEARSRLAVAAEDSPVNGRVKP